MFPLKNIFLQRNFEQKSVTSGQKKGRKKGAKKTKKEKKRLET